MMLLIIYFSGNSPLTRFAHIVERMQFLIMFNLLIEHATFVIITGSSEKKVRQSQQKIIKIKCICTLQKGTYIMRNFPNSYFVPVLVEFPGKTVLSSITTRLSRIQTEFHCFLMLLLVYHLQVICFYHKCILIYVNI